MAEVLLDVKNLVTNFYTRRGVVHAVRDVSYQVHRGEMVGIVGESGSGKSVSAFSVLGLVKKPGKIESGQVIFKGKDLRTLSPKELLAYRGRYMSMIFQEPLSALNPAYTVGWQIAEAFRNNGMTDKKEIEERVVEMLAKVKLPDPARRAKEFSYQFSGGMRQRALIAMALASNPELVFADEPTTALDVTVQADILDLIGELQQDMGMAVVLVSHNLNLVGERCQRILVMYAGQIVEEAPSMDLFTDPRHPYTKCLLKSLPGNSEGQNFFVIPGEIRNALDNTKGCAFANRCYRAEAKCFEEEPEMVQLSENRCARCHFCKEGI